MLSMLAVAVLFSSCKDDEEDDITTPQVGPNLTLTPESIEAWIGDQVAIEYTISTASSNAIVSLDITTNETEIASQLFGEELDNNFVNDSIVFAMPVGPAGNPWVSGGFFTVTFDAVHEVDGIQYSTAKTVTCTYVEPTNPLVEYTGQLNHILDGDTFGAYNLVDDVTVPSDPMMDADKDMIHMTDGDSDTFNPVWTIGTGNNTDYVLANNVDYDNITIDEMIAVYEGGTAITDVTFAVGEVYVARLRGGDEGYAIIRIDAINIVEDTNDDNMMFSYKK